MPVALRLARRVNGGYDDALKLLQRYLPDENPRHDTTGRLHLLRALAYGQQWHALSEHDPTRDTLKTRIIGDLKFAFNHDQRKDEVAPLLDPRRGQPRPDREPDDKGDDLVGILSSEEIAQLPDGPSRKSVRR